MSGLVKLRCGAGDGDECLLWADCYAPILGLMVGSYVVTDDCGTLWIFQSATEFSFIKHAL
jgi:hypothetical protein